MNSTLIQLGSKFSTSKSISTKILKLRILKRIFLFVVLGETIAIIKI